MTGTGDAASFAYTKSVIEYASAADLAAVNTLTKQLTNVTDLKVTSLTPGTVELILGSDFTGLKPQSPATPASPASAASSASLQPLRLRQRRREPGPVQRRYHRGSRLRQ